MKFAAILLLIYWVELTLNQSSIQNLVKDIDRRALVNIERYRNTFNKGPYKACCGDREGLTCLECRYKAEVHLDSNYYWISKYNKVYPLGTFSRKANELSEYFSTEIFYSKSHTRSVYVVIYNVDNTKLEIEQTYDLDSWNIINYVFGDGYGYYNTMSMWGSIILTPISRNDKIAYFNVILHSIFFKSYKTASGKCCARGGDRECSSPCDYYTYISTQNYYSSGSKDIKASPNGKYQKLKVQMGINYLTRSAVNSINLRIVSYETYYYIDVFLIKSNFKGEPGKIYYMDNVVGSYGNVVINISYGFICERYATEYCKKACFVLTGTEYCDLKTGEQKCKNGAVDDNLCEKFTEICDNTVCNNEGRCTLENNKRKCYCNKGYYGKFCQYWRCENECNGNGQCIAPNKCKCNDGIRGEFCDEFPCEGYIQNTCGKFSECYGVNSSVKCYCTNNLTSGKYCDEAICNPKCFNGKCHYFEDKSATKCVCFDQYQGETCDKLVEYQSVNTKSTTFTSFLSFVIIATIVVSILFILIYLKFIPLNFSYGRKGQFKEDIDE